MYVFYISFEVLLESNTQNTDNKKLKKGVLTLGSVKKEINYWIKG